MKNKFKIVIVDKDQSFIDALSQRLKSWDIESIGTTNGASLFQISSQFKPDIILLADDIKSPTWTEVLKRIKQANSFEQPAIFILCSQTTTGLIHQAKLYELQNIIQKPIVFADFLKRVQKEFKRKTNE